MDAVHRKDFLVFTRVQLVELWHRASHDALECTLNHKTNWKPHSLASVNLNDPAPLSPTVSTITAYVGWMRVVHQWPMRSVGGQI